MFIIFWAEVVAYYHHFLEFALMTFGRHHQVGDKLRPVFDPLHIVPEHLAESPLCEPEASAIPDPMSADSW
jgi:hypothetical protein